MDSPEVFLGVDGGGTKTIGVLADAKGVELARRMTGATNPNVVGLETAGERLAEIVTGCCTDARCGVDAVRGAVFGLAGAGNDENKKYLREALHRSFTSAFPAKIETDARIALEGAFTGGPGIVVIAGTGSVVVAKTPQGEIFQIGGWGRLLGDDGSGYFLGVELEREFSRIVDGLSESPVMSRVLSERLGWSSRAHLIAAVYREKLEPSTLAPLVMDLAEQNEPRSLEILHRGAVALTEQILVARRKFGPSVVRVATIGGLLDKPTVYRNVLVSLLREAGADVDIGMPDRPAVEGAVLMAIGSGTRG